MAGWGIPFFQRINAMNDLIYIAALCGFFLLTGSYVKFCAKL